jgi:hypothetical protein
VDSENGGGRGTDVTDVDSPSSTWASTHPTLRRADGRESECWRNEAWIVGHDAIGAKVVSKEARVRFDAVE